MLVVVVGVGVSVTCGRGGDVGVVVAFADAVGYPVLVRYAWRLKGEVVVVVAGGGGVVVALADVVGRYHVLFRHVNADVDFILRI